jgi:putative glycosyltransferase (TIGR04372 family)
VSIRLNDLGVKRLVDWARQQKRQGNLKQVFRVYTWWKQTEGKIRVWWRRDAARVIYHWGVALRPNWGNGHYTLGKALQLRYSFLATRELGDQRALVDIENRAIAHFRKVLEFNPERLEAYEELFSSLYIMGRIEEASIVLQQFDDLKRNLAELYQEDQLDLRFVPTRIASSIGLLGNLDFYVKAGLLGWRKPHKIVMLLPDETSVSNRCFLDYWRQYVTVISDPKMIKTLSPMAKHLEDPINWAQTINGQALFLSAAITMVQKQWDSEKRGPLLTLSTSDYERGCRCLEGLGVPKSSWYVCLHVRESGFKGGSSKFDAYRNADIDTYLPAIKTIVAHGGWVIRMGNPTMSPLPEMEHLIDYAHSDVRSDWMDVFLSAQCRFFIDTSSGLGTISMAFGVPNVRTNYLPWNTMFFSNKDLVLPRLFWSLKEKRRLSFAEILSSSVSAGVDQSSYDRLGVEILQNTPEEINDIVLEMILRLDGNLTYSASEEQLQERFRSLTGACGTFVGQKDLMINARIGKDFLRKYETLFDTEVDREIKAGGHGDGYGRETAESTGRPV